MATINYYPPPGSYLDSATAAAAVNYYPIPWNAIPGRVLDLDSSVGVTTVAGAKVSAWENQSPIGSVNNVTQAVDVNRPVLNADRINGFPAITGTDTTWLNCAANIVSGARSIFTVCKPSSAAGGALFETRTSAVVHADLMLAIAGTQYFASDGTTNDSRVAIDYTDTLLVTQHTWAGAGNPEASIINGVPVVLTASGSLIAETGATGATVMGRVAAANQCFVGDVARFIVFSRVLSTAEAASVRAFLGLRYNGIGS